MTDKPGRTYEQWLSEVQISWINQPVEVDFTVRVETARQRADRVWKMKSEDEVAKC
jgi:hypothetical protein